MDSRELAVMRKQTKHFIDDNPTVVTITRGGTRTGDGAGGYTTAAGAPVAEQTIRLVPQDLRTGMTSSNVDGEEINPRYVAIALHDADIEKDDVFVINSRNYEVTFVRDDRRYETWAEVVYRG